MSERFDLWLRAGMEQLRHREQAARLTSPALTTAEFGYRVWRQPGDLEQYVQSPEKGIALIRRMALEDLRNPAVSWNAFGLQEKLPDGDWVEWYDDQGRSADDLARAEAQGLAAL